MRANTHSIYKATGGLMLLFSASLVAADDLSDIDNYRQYSPEFSSSGQPSVSQLEVVSEAGFERVIYLAFSDNQTAIEAEDRVVKKTWHGLRAYPGGF